MSSPKRQLILVVDDDRDMNRLLTIALERAGFQTHAVYDGDESLAWLRDNVPDGIVLDIMMPTVDGIEVLKAIRAEKRIKQTPVVIFSAMASELNDQARRRMGADSYLDKPVGVWELTKEIKRLLKS